MSDALPHSHDATQFMQCMEVWGGNQSADRGVVMAGLDAWVYSRPFGNAQGGGDVYYVSSCATGRITRLLVADVAGHGDVVAGMASSLRTLMRQHVNHIDQCKFVRAMNRQFVELSNAGCFATAVVTTFFGPTNQLSLCNAGHPPPLVYRVRSRKWDYLTADFEAGNIPLGIDDIDDYAQFKVRLDVNDLVLCYTDSLIEARMPDGQLLGTAGLKRIVESLNLSDPGQFISRLLEALNTRCPGGLDNDDVTILFFRPNGIGRNSTFFKRLMAPIRLGWTILKRPFGGEPIPWPDFSLENLGGAVFARRSGQVGQKENPG